jgi:Flp pilus assembly protein TadG
MIRRSVFLSRFASQTKATASTEFALMVPMLVILLFGGAEAGHFVWTQHKLTEAVRDGARFASRLPVAGTDGVCDGATAQLSTADEDNIKLITRTGQLANTGARPVVPGWTAAQVTVTVTCDAFVDTGIYSDLGDNDASGANDAGPMVTVRATNVTYPSLFNGLAVLGGGISLNAQSNAAVIGI